MVGKETLLFAIAGKLAERGVRPEMDAERNMITAWYDEPVDDRKDDLHKQSVRALVERMGEDNWKCHISTMGESGFNVEIRTIPQAGASTTLNLTDEGVTNLNQLADSLEDIAKQLRETA